MWWRLLGAAVLAACASGGDFPWDTDAETGGPGGGGADADPMVQAPDAHPADAATVGSSDAAPLPDSMMDAIACTEGVTYAANGHCYIFVNSNKSWDQSSTSCAAVGAYLVTIRDLAENDFVRSLVGSHGPWIGADDKASEGTFVWVTGEHFLFTNWDGGQPDNGSGSEDCALMRGGSGGRWNDDQCGQGHSYVCERGGY